VQLALWRAVFQDQAGSLEKHLGEQWIVIRRKLSRGGDHCL
jgi:hypothetical protein